MKTIFYQHSAFPLSRKNFKRMTRHFTVIKAGGGLVIAPDGRYLMIYRHGLWDLPKGKQEPGEKMEVCAHREIAEECAIDQLRLTAKLPKTYHIYGIAQGEIALKKCYWYEFQAPEASALHPQENEGITQAVWMTQKEVEQCYAQMFGSVRHLLKAYFRQKSTFRFPWFSR